MRCDILWEFFDGEDVLNLREKKDVFLLVSYIFETKNVD